MGYQMKTEEIRGIMQRRGVTLAELAEEVGTEETRLDQALNGYQFLSEANAIRIMDGLESIKKKRARVPKMT